jgi:hypothetical protein
VETNQTPKLNEALAKAQAGIKEAAKDGFNPHFQKSYVTLGSDWAACRESLTKNGLSVTQGTEQTEPGKLSLRTTLLHSSGEERSFLMPLILQRQDMQGLGSAITYARRYSLESIVGIASDDDDANDAVTKQAPQKTETKAPAPKAPSKSKTMSSVELANFEMPFGKYKGKKLWEITLSDLTSYADFMAAKMAGEKNPDPRGVEVFEIVDRWLVESGEMKNAGGETGTTGKTSGGVGKETPQTQEDIPF